MYGKLAVYLHLSNKQVDKMSERREVYEVFKHKLQSAMRAIGRD